MRFFLDNDVDAEVCAVIRRAGFDCWTAANAILTNDEDDDLGVYADNKGAVMVTHDREFTNRRAENPYGQHVRLTCRNADAVEVMAAQLDEVCERLSQLSPCVLIVSPTRVKVRYPQWSP